MKNRALEALRERLRNRAGAGTLDGQKPAESSLSATNPEGSEIKNVLTYDSDVDEWVLTVSPEELRGLARYWATPLIDSRLAYMYMGSADSIFDAKVRLALIAEALGDDEVDRIIAEVEDGARKAIGDRDWRVFESECRTQWQLLSILAQYAGACSCGQRVELTEWLTNGKRCE